MTTKTNKIGRYVLITTKHRGVFAGVLCAFERHAGQLPTATLESARCAISFGTTGGVLELADTGPTGRSRIGAVAPEIELEDVTSTILISKRAEAKWRDA